MSFVEAHTIFVWISNIGTYVDQTKHEIRQLTLTSTYRFNKTIATATIRFIVTIAFVIYMNVQPVVYRMLTLLAALSLDLFNLVSCNHDIIVLMPQIYIMLVSGATVLLRTLTKYVKKEQADIDMT